VDREHLEIAVAAAAAHPQGVLPNPFDGRASVRASPKYLWNSAEIRARADARLRWGGCGAGPQKQKRHPPWGADASVETDSAGLRLA